MTDSFDRELEKLLEYGEAPQTEAFVIDVMRHLRRERRVRRAVLWSFGGVGALFGLAGAAMLSGPLGRLFAFSLNLPATETMQVSLVIVAAAAFYLWFMNDDFSLGR